MLLIPLTVTLPQIFVRYIPHASATLPQHDTRKSAIASSGSQESPQAETEDARTTLCHRTPIHRKAQVDVSTVYDRAIDNVDEIELEPIGCQSNTTAMARPYFFAANQHSSSL